MTQVISTKSKFIVNTNSVFEIAADVKSSLMEYASINNMRATTPTNSLRNPPIKTTHAIVNKNLMINIKK